ncbi:MAG: calcium/sodium antiporter [Methanimicrococcus sp.]|nr:calcium/sodium antiporter [Methanimicrococcus sp.]
MIFSDLLVYFLFFIGFCFIAVGADWFVDSAVNISKRSGIPKAVIGATIVSFATTAPEFMVSFLAAIQGHSDMAIGNAVGSTICNIGIAVGFIVMLKTVAIDDKKFSVKALMMLLAGGVLVLVSLNGVITRLHGTIFLILFAAYIFYIYWEQKRNPKKESGEKESDDSGIVQKGIWSHVKINGKYLDAIVFLIGGALVVIGSRLIVDNGLLIAVKIGIPEIIISLTVISIGTALPEIITAFTSFRKGFQELSVGNIVGSNILDITMILGVSSMFVDLNVNSQLLRYDYIFMLLLFVLLVFFGYKKRITRSQGALIALIYIIYVAGLFLFV